MAGHMIHKREIADRIEHIVELSLQEDNSDETLEQLDLYADVLQHIAEHSTCAESRELAQLALTCEEHTGNG